MPSAEPLLEAVELLVVVSAVGTELEQVMALTPVPRQQE